MKRIALFASGSGSNAENIVRYFAENSEIQVVAIFTNRPDAYVIQRAQTLQVPCFIFSKSAWKSGEICSKLREMEIEWIILAGFLWLVPEEIIAHFPNRIINIHPALLPDYGGKGMFGHHVHEAVIQNKESQSGITIHLVNAEYDKGEVLFQAVCPVTPDDTPESLAAKVHELEYIHFPTIIQQAIQKAHS